MFLNILESPRLLLVLGISLEVVCLLIYLVKRQPRFAWLLLAGPMLAIAAFALDAAVETNSEALTRVTHELLDSLEQGSAPAFLDNVSDSFILPNGFDKPYISNKLQKYLSQPLIENNHINSLQVTNAQPQQGSVEVALTTLIDPDAPAHIALVRVARSSWRFDFIRDPDHNYRLYTVEMLSFNDSEPFNIFMY